MHVHAISAQRWIEATRAVAGSRAKIVSVPPDAVDLAEATRADVLYLNLHGYKGRPEFRGQGRGQYSRRPVAFTPRQVAKVDWSGTVVFAEVCYSALNEKMVRAFMDRRARAFIGSTSEAYGRVRPVMGKDAWGDRLAKLFLGLSWLGGSPTDTLYLAKLAFTIVSYPISREDQKTIDSFIVVEEQNEQ